MQQRWKGRTMRLPRRVSPSRFTAGAMTPVKISVCTQMGPYSCTVAGDDNIRKWCKCA